MLRDGLSPRRTAVEDLDFGPVEAAGVEDNTSSNDLSHCPGDSFHGVNVFSSSGCCPRGLKTNVLGHLLAQIARSSAHCF